MAKKKICTFCKQTKRIALFFRIRNTKLKGADGRTKMCKQCIANKNSLSNANILSRNSYFKRNYSITLIERNKMAEEQNYCCAICGIHESKLTKGLHLDHCHATGKIRKLLCSVCNTQLGIVENKSFLDKAKLYLEKF